MDQPHLPGSPWPGTLCGTLLVLVIQINLVSLVQSIVLAAVGSIVSFLVSALIHWLARKVKKKKGS